MVYKWQLLASAEVPLTGRLASVASCLTEAAPQCARVARPSVCACQWAAPLLIGAQMSAARGGSPRPLAVAQRGLRVRVAREPGARSGRLAGRALS
jgi:hypothetical protein